MKGALTPEEFEAGMLALLKEKAENPDFTTQELHEEMDKLMCEFLINLGYGAGVKIFRDTKKWYA